MTPARCSAGRGKDARQKERADDKMEHAEWSIGGRLYGAGRAIARTQRQLTLDEHRRATKIAAGIVFIWHGRRQFTVLRCRWACGVVLGEARDRQGRLRHRERCGIQEVVEAYGHNSGHRCAVCGDTGRGGDYQIRSLGVTISAVAGRRPPWRWSCWRAADPRSSSRSAKSTETSAALGLATPGRGRGGATRRTRARGARRPGWSRPWRSRRAINTVKSVESLQAGTHAPLHGHAGDRSGGRRVRERAGAREHDARAAGW